MAKLNAMLHEIDKNFIMIKDYSQQFNIFKEVFDKVTDKMREEDNYMKRYCKGVQYAGSFYDGVKVGQLDEFDTDIVVNLPINYESIVIENSIAGFVKLKVEEFDHLDGQTDWESHHKVTRNWRDEKKYLLHSTFRSWIEGVVNKALTALNHRVTVNGQVYHLSVRKTGPAFTVNCKPELATQIAVDVDLVPVIRFPGKQWPLGYRSAAATCANKDYWLAVPKPSKSLEGRARDTSWRVAFHEQERDIIHGCNNLKPTLRLMKKLRDATNMTGIASYYIKTLFLWEVHSRGKKYWEASQSFLFKTMVEKLYEAVKEKNIPYYWNAKYNLIKDLNANNLRQYEEKLKKLLSDLESLNLASIATTLLTAEEFDQFKNSAVFTNCLNQQWRREAPVITFHSAPRQNDRVHRFASYLQSQF